MKRKIALAAALALIFLAACTGGEKEPDFTTLPAVTPSPVTEEITPPDVPEHLRVLADVDGDGEQESLLLGGFDEHATAASLWADGEKVMDFTGMGELDESTCRLSAADLDGDGRDEVLVCIDIAARYGWVPLRCVKLEDGTWREASAMLHSLALTLADGWQCTLTDGEQSWTVEIRNPSARAAWFDASGAPTAGPMSVGAFADRTEHVITDRGVRFEAGIIVQDQMAEGLSSDVELRTQVTASLEGGELVTDDSLGRALLAWLEDADWDVPIE